MSTVTLRIQVDKSGASENIGAVKRDLQGMGETGAQAGAQASGGVNGLSSAINGAKAAVGAFVAAYAAVQTLTGVVRLADEYQGMSDRLRLATSSTAEFTAAQAGVFAVAQQTGSALGAVNDLYVGLARSTEQLGLNQGELLTITAAINQSFAISGTSAGAAEAATRQLGQAFASGVLRGDEFNSMMENAPGLASALATSLGVTTGELRAMAAAGELTSEVLATGLLQQAPAIAEQFGQMGLTVGRAFQQVSNAVLVAVGAFNESTGASASLAAQVSQLAGVITNIATLFVATGERSAAASDDVGVLTRAFQGLAVAAALVVNAVQAMVQFVAGALEGTADLISGVAAAAEAASTGAFDRTAMLLTLDFKGFAEAQLGATTAAFAAMGEGATQATDAVSRGLAGASSESDDFSDALSAILAPLEQSTTKTESLAGALGAVTVPAKQSAEQLKEVEKAASAAGRAAEALQKEQERLTAEVAGPTVAAYIELAQRLRAVDEWEQQLRADQGLSAAEARQLRDVRISLTSALINETAAVQALANPYETYLAKLTRERQLLGMSNAERAIAESRLRAVTTVMTYANEQRERGNGLLVDEIEKLILQEEALDASAAATERAAAEALEWQQYWEGATDAVLDAFAGLFSGGIDSLEDFGDEMIRITQRIVGDMIKEFARTGRIQFNGSDGTTAGNIGAGAQGLAFAYGAYQNARQGGNPALTIGGGALAGAQIGSIFGPIGTAVGAIVGAIAGAAMAIFGGPGDPLLRVRSSEFSGPRRSEGQAQSALGNIFVRTENTPDGAGTSPEIAQRIADFDNLIAGFLSADQLSVVRTALANVNDTFENGAFTLENALNSRLGTILGVLGDDIDTFVGDAGTLEQRMGRLVDALVISSAAATGIVSSDFGEMATLLTRFRVGAEGLGDVFLRTVAGMSLVDDALLLLGGTFSGTRLQAATFAGELIELAGGFDQFASRLNGALNALFSEDERNQFIADQAQGALNEALRGLNISGSLESVRTQLRDQLRLAMEAGNSALVNSLLIAGNALGAFSTAVGNLGDEAVAAANGLTFGSSNAAGTIGPGAGLTSPAGTAAQTQVQAVQTTNSILSTQTGILQQIQLNTARGVGLTPGASPKTGGDATAVLVQIKALIERAISAQTQESLKRTTGANKRTSAA